MKDNKIFFSKVDLPGTYKLKILLTDANGGESIYNLEVIIKFKLDDIIFDEYANEIE